MELVNEEDVVIKDNKTKLELVSEEDVIRRGNESKEALEIRRQHKEYRDTSAIEKGFKDDNDRRNHQRWESGKVIKLQDHKECESYTGCIVGEDNIARPILDKMFEETNKKKFNNPGFEFICKNPIQEFIDKYPQFKLERNKEYRIDVKTAHFLNEYWKFRINYNNNADFFLLIGLNVIGYTSEHTWFVHKNDIIRNKQFWKRSGICIAKYHLCAFNRYNINISDNNQKIRLEV